MYHGKLSKMNYELAQHKKNLANNMSSSNLDSLGRGSKVYVPKEYFKRVGYQASETGSQKQKDQESTVTHDALGQRVRERFNEQVDDNAYNQDPKSQ